ncbi:TPA: aldo/keto reductase [Escherichia coli]|nr:aldo/keto reductase [Escherichia coli]
MQYNPLGKTDLRVSRLCLGCMTFGEPDRVMRRAINALYLVR